MKNTDEERVELAEYARIVWKRRGLVLLPTLLVLATAAVALHFMTPIYVSNALIQIVDRDPIHEVADVVTGQRRRGDRPRDQDSQKLAQINQQVKGQPFLEPVGRALGLDLDPGIQAGARRKAAQFPDLSEEELIVRTYTKFLKEKIEVEKGGIDLFRFNCEDEDPVKAYQLARAVAEEYERYTLKIGVEISERTGEFTQEQLEDARARLRVAERRLNEYQRRVNMSVLRQSNPVSDKNFGDTRRLLDEAALELTTLEHRINRGVERLPPTLGGVADLERAVTSARLSRLARALWNAEREQVPLMIQEGATTGLQRSVGAEVSRIRQDIFVEMRDLVGKRFPRESSAVQKQIGDVIFDRIILRSVEARREEIDKLVRDFSNRVALQPEQEQELDRLEAEVSTLRRRVGDIEANQLDREMREEADRVSVQARVKVIEAPSVPVDPDRPDKLRIMLLALVAGPFLGLGAVVLSEYLDTSFRSVEEIEEMLELPVLGTIPQLGTASRTRSARRRSGGGPRRRQVGAASLLLIVVTGVSGAWFAPPEAAAEQSAGTPSQTG